MTLICLRGAKEICAAVGENPKEIVRLVEEEGLPAWKRAGRGPWRALPADLARWVRAQRDLCLGGPAPPGPGQEVEQIQAPGRIAGPG